jgi:signal transduction histidine kinase
MSHELRTPLNAIIGFSEMMDAGYFGKLSPKQKERVHDIHLCGNHLLQLINDILEFSKTEAGKMELAESWFDISRNIRECVRMIEPRARGKGLEIKLELPEEGPDFYGDSRKIRQLLLNLLTNAMKFTDEGHIRVRYHTNNRREPVITVEDSGIGMREEDIPVALSVFGQVHRNTHPEGTGLGLPLCRMFTEIHGGELTIQSQPGIGTAVSVSFPAFRLEKPSAESPVK